MAWYIWHALAHLVRASHYQEEDEMNDWTLAAICALLITSVLIIIALGLGILIKTGLMVVLVVLSVLGVGLTLHL
nr:MAG TPA: hypothetical protein [Caudoviricetes sp.]